MFENIVGHEFQKKLFNPDNDLRSSYIFEGPSGIGKFTFAKEIAQYHSGGIQQNIHIIDKDSISVDDVRTVCEEVQRFPYMNKKRIVIINDAEKLNDVSQNTLLKIMETPPANVHFILICTDSGLLLKTIASRCIICKFDFLNSEIIKDVIEKELDVKDPVLLNFITVSIRGCIGRVFDMKNSGTDYYVLLFDLINKLESTSSSKYVLPLSEMLSTTNPNRMFCELVDMSCWFSYKYINGGEERYRVYSKILNDILEKITSGGSTIFCGELAVIRILKHNESVKNKSKSKTK